MHGLLHLPLLITYKVMHLSHLHIHQPPPPPYIYIYALINYLCIKKHWSTFLYIYTDPPSPTYVFIIDSPPPPLLPIHWSATLSMNWSTSPCLYINPHQSSYIHTIPCTESISCSRRKGLLGLALTYLTLGRLLLWFIFFMCGKMSPYDDDNEHSSSWCCLPSPTTSLLFSYILILNSSPSLFK